MAKKSKKEQKAENNKKNRDNSKPTRRPKQKGKVTKQVAQKDSTFMYETQKSLQQKKLDELMAMNPTACIHNMRDVARKWAMLQMRKQQPSNQSKFDTNKFANLKKVLRLEA